VSDLLLGFFSACFAADMSPLSYSPLLPQRDKRLWNLAPYCYLAVHCRSRKNEPVKLGFSQIHVPWSDLPVPRHGGAVTDAFCAIGASQRFSSWASSLV